MIDLDLNLEKMFELIGDTRLVRFDVLVPLEIPNCPPSALWKPPREYLVPPKDYELPNIDLWAQFVKDQYSGLDEIVKLVRTALNTNKIGPYVLSVALENAFYHGNQNNPALPVTVKTFQGTGGVVVRIRDSGSGFDFAKVTRQFKEVEKRKLMVYSHPEDVPKDLKYFSRRGRGFYAYEYSRPKISFENQGTVVNVLYARD
ncbi:MAG: ATP-binding protein [Nanoarchaeota archaeon]|nr:ATP-binding protein [Nanoarchaeota archaeon]MBU4086372.1 ATP-binding protein [Nanoarchaeota archaeon]